MEATTIQVETTQAVVDLKDSRIYGFTESWNYGITICRFKDVELYVFCILLLFS